MGNIGFQFQSFLKCCSPVLASGANAQSLGTEPTAIYPIESIFSVEVC